MKAAISNIMPNNLTNAAKRLYYLIPLKYRMGKKYYEIKKFLEKAQWWNSQKIEEWQLQHLKKIVRYAYENVPGYYSLYKAAGIQADDIQTLDDIKILPFVTKEMIRDNLKDFTSTAVPFKNRIYGTTGGSTGIPLGFYSSKLNAVVEDAFMHSGWQRTGWILGDCSAVLMGRFIGSKNKFYESSSNRKELLLSIYHLTEQTYEKYLQKILDSKPLHLRAYPSAATILADLILDKGDVERINFKTIFLASENVYDWQKQKLLQAFPQSKLFAWYGHTEQVILAHMCEHSSQYHVWPFYGFTEILDRNYKEVSEGGIGELVGSSFWNYTTPFIRYQTMDMAQRGKYACEKCNRQFQLLDKIEGRMHDYVVMNDGDYVPLTALVFARHFRAFATIKQIQLYQDKPGELVVKIVPTDRFSKREEEEIQGKIEKAVPGRIKAQVKIVNEILRTQIGKCKILDQKLKIIYPQ